MRSTITARSQTVLPAPICERFGLGPSTRLEWIVDGGGAGVVGLIRIEAERGRPFSSKTPQPERKAKIQQRWPPGGDRWWHWMAGICATLRPPLPDPVAKRSRHGEGAQASRDQTEG
jgi:bifunctional DNA-binding transcriptional regulator/antitoxin component of YhaV-PrlF toxin-antitoxin module